MNIRHNSKTSHCHHDAILMNMQLKGKKEHPTALSFSAYSSFYFLFGLFC